MKGSDPFMCPLGAARPGARLTVPRALSSVGRAPARQAGGHWFEPSSAHLLTPRIFKVRSGHLVFAPGETKKGIVVKILGDPKAEKKERFSVALSKPSNATLGDDTGTVTIRKSD
jgi:hypothetical protein